MANTNYESFNDDLNDETKKDNTTDNNEDETLKKVEDSDEDDDIYAKFNDGEDEGSDQSDDSSKKKQSKEENHRQAELRRQREQKAQQDAYNKGLIEGIGGKNPYTDEKIEDEYDLQTYLNMKEISKRGGDPVEDYHKYLKVFNQEQAKKDEEAHKEEIERYNSIENQKKEFDEKYPNVKRKDILTNQEFRELFEEDLNNGQTTLVKAYEKFLKIQGKIDKVKKSKVDRSDDRDWASAGSMSNDGEDSKKGWLDMTDDEFRKARKSRRGF